MSLKNILKQGLDSSDERKLINLINQIKDLNQSLIDKYELRADLVQLRDKRQGAARLVKEEIDTLRSEIQDLMQKKQDLTTEIKEVLTLKESVEELDSLINKKISDGRSLTEAIEYLLSEENYENWQFKSDNLNKTYDDLFSPIEQSNQTKYEVIQEAYNKSEELNKFLFKDDESIQVDGVTTYRAFKLRTTYKSIEDYHRNLFENSFDNDGNEVPSISSQIKKQKNDLELFHNKIFGTNNPEKKSLSDTLDERLISLKRIEKEAINVMNLSSTAGLASGFFQKGKEARVNRVLSLTVFALSLIVLAVLNFKTIDWKNLDDITIQSIIIRSLLNLPLIWLATVANINLNKYSKLEQEYGHKESLARSYEKYRDEIRKLPANDDYDLETHAKLHAELIKLNLEAFKKNPTEDMDRAKSNLGFDSLFTPKKDPEDQK